MGDDDAQQQGILTFVCIMTSAFFVFVFINGIVHSFYEPGTSDEVLRFCNTMMPIIVTVALFALLWVVVNRFKKHKYANPFLLLVGLSP